MSQSKPIRHDLVRIDRTGAAHPVGKLASQRMRARGGAFRLMPSPNHVVFMRYVGEDGVRDEDDGPVIKLAGEVTSANHMCDVVSLVIQSGWRGELFVVDDQCDRSIFFEKGNVIGAHSNADRERIGEVLFRYGALDEDQIEHVVNVSQPGQRFGEVAADLGLLSREKLYQLMSKQTEEIVLGTLRVDEGTFYFLDRFDESRLTSRHVLKGDALLMEGVRRMDEMSYFRQRIPSDLCVPIRIRSDVQAPEDCKGVFELSDGNSSIAEIGRYLQMGEFETTRLVYQLMQAKLVQIRPPRPTGPEAVVELFNGAIVHITTAATEVERGAFLREQLSMFRESAGMYEAVFRDAGPREDGTFEPGRVAQNARRIGGAASTASLAQLLYEYAAFALFVARQTVPPENEAKLTEEVGQRLAPLTASG